MSTHPPMNISTAAKAGLSLGALGVVFGDIGTSPLYTMRECMAHLPAVERVDGVLGVLSLIFWSLVLVVNLYFFSLKDLFFHLKKNNKNYIKKI